MTSTDRYDKMASDIRRPGMERADGGAGCQGADSARHARGLEPQHPALDVPHPARLDRHPARLFAPLPGGRAISTPAKTALSFF